MAVKAQVSITISHLIDISSITRYYLLQSSTSAAPAKPTINPPPSGWNDAEPSYTSGSKNTLYFVDCTEFTNGTFKYSEVSKSSSYEAAKEAYDKAAAVKTEVTDYVASRGENLVTNGTALLGDNTNFSGFTYDGEDTYYSGGSFKIIARQTMKVSDEYIPIDISQPYILTYWIKSSSSTGKYYDFLDMYDIDRNRIYANNVMWVDGSTTTLSQDLNDGDTVVYLQSVSGFNTTSTNSGLHGFIFWNYKNSKGYQYDIHTYSRNTYNSLWDDSSAINTENNTITLKQPWTHGKFLKGVPVSQSNSGSTYSYLNGNYSLTPNVWTEKKGTLYGLGSNGEIGKFREGTAFVRLGWLINYGGEASDVTRLSTISLTQTAGMADLEKIQIGARNLLVGTSIPAAYTKTGATYETDVLYQFSDYCKSITGRNSKQFTLSFEWETTATSGHFEVFGNTAPRVYPTGSIYISPSNQSGKVVRTFTFPGDTETAFSLRCYSLTGTITIKNAMLELANKASSWQPAPEDVDEDIDNTASDLQTIMREQNDSVIESCNDNINKALGDYVKTGDYEAYKETVTAQLEIMASQIEMNFTTTTESINTTNGTVQNKFEELSKYIRFSSDGIEIGSDTNTLKLTLDNDMIRFERDGDTIGWWDGVDFHTGNIMVDVTERAQFGNFAFIPRSDGSLMFLKVDNIIGGNLFNLKNCEFESNIISYTPIGSTGAHVHITQSTLSSVHFTLDATKTYRISYVAKNALINGYDSSSTPWVKKFEQQGDGMQSITVTGAHEYYFGALEVDDYMFKDVRIVEVS